MTKLVKVASRSGWLKDIAAFTSIGAFLWMASTWAEIARSVLS